MIERADAIRSVERALAEHWGSDDVEEVVTHVSEHPECWAITCQSKAYVESGDIRDMLVGRGPFIVDRATGKIHETGSGQSEETSVEAFRRWGDPYGPPPLEDSHRRLLRVVGSGRDRLGPRTSTVETRVRSEPWASATSDLLNELESRGLADGSGGRWVLTDAGRAVEQDGRSAPSFESGP